MEIGIDTFVASRNSGIVENDEIAISNLLERIEFADKIGLDLYGIGEHHNKYMLDSSHVVLLAAAAARTKRIRLTSAVTGISTADPVRVFQDFATLDLISKGRAELIVGRGASVEAFPLFGFNMDDSAEIFTEKLGLLLHIFSNETVTWSGKFRPAIDNVGIYPRPLQKSLPIWHAALRTPASFTRAGELGLPLMLAIIDGQSSQFRPLLDLYKEAGRDAGLKKNQLKVGLHTMGYLADTTEQAIEEFYPGWVQSMSKMHITPKTKTRFELDLKAKGSTLLVGSAEDVAEKISRLSVELGGITRCCFQMDYAGLPHEKLLKSIDLIGNKLIPLIKSRS